MSERYCPECKQNVDQQEIFGGPFLAMCSVCAYEFDVAVDKAELEELVGKLEYSARLLLLSGREETGRQAEETAAKFRAKYLEGK